MTVADDLRARVEAIINTAGPGGTSRSETVEALMALLAAQQGPEIKGLEWRQTAFTPRASPEWQADHAFGFYVIQCTRLVGQYFVPQLADQTFDSLHEAKAAAQADYETRIRSDLAPSVVAEPTQTSGSNNVPPGTPLNAPSVFGFGAPSPHRGEPDVLRDAVAMTETEELIERLRAPLGDIDYLPIGIAPPCATWTG